MLLALPEMFCCFLHYSLSPCNFKKRHGLNHGGGKYKEPQNNKPSGPRQVKLRQKSEPRFVCKDSNKV